MSKIPGYSPTKRWNRKQCRTRFSKTVVSSSWTADMIWLQFQFFFQLFDTCNKEYQFLAKAFLRIFLAMPVIYSPHPAQCDHTSSGLLRVEAKRFRLSNFVTNLWIQDFVGTLSSPYLFRNALWHRLNEPGRQYSKTINTSCSAEYVFAAHTITLHWVKRLFGGRVSTSRVQTTSLRGVMILFRC
jgi:hypothetical protein